MAGKRKRGQADDGTPAEGEEPEEGAEGEDFDGEPEGDAEAGEAGEEGGDWQKGEDGRPDGFWNPKPKTSVEGVLLTRKTKLDRKGKTRAYYLVRLTKRAHATLPKKDGQKKGDAVMLAAGRILHVDERSNIEGMARLASKGYGKYLIRIDCHEKRQMAGGDQSVWDLDWFHRINPDRDEDDAPF